GGKARRERPRARPRRLRLAGVDQRRVGREIAMRRLPRRLDHKSAEIEIARKLAGGDALVDQGGHARLEVRKNVHLSPKSKEACASNPSQATRQKVGHAREWRTCRSFRQCSPRPPARVRPARPWPPNR